MAAVFAIIIITSRLSPKKETGFSEVSDANKEFYKVAYEDQLQENEQENGTSKPEEPKEPEITMDEVFGVVNIDYTNEGFKPGIIRIRVGQNVNWTNKTDKSIFLRQRKQTYDEFNEPVEIKPGESYKFKMSVLGIWTYEEVESEKFGSIEAKPLPKVIPQPTVPATTEPDTNSTGTAPAL